MFFLRNQQTIVLQLLFISLFIDKLRSQKFFIFYTAPCKLTFGTQKSWRFRRWISFSFPGDFQVNHLSFSGFGPVQGLCFSEPLGPGYGTSTVPWVKTLQGAFLLWKIYQSVGFYPNKNHRNPPISTKNWGCGNTSFWIYKTLGTSIDHWLLWRWEWGATLHSIRIVVRWRGQLFGAMKLVKLPWLSGDSATSC